jgi:tartrate dehydrogenase/decarboxylase/D-malate dehydrogenase
MAAIERVTADPSLHTGDLGGTATTVQVTDAVCALLASQASAEAKAA